MIATIYCVVLAGLFALNLYAGWRVWMEERCRHYPRDRDEQYVNATNGEIRYFPHGSDPGEPWEYGNNPVHYQYD